MLFVAYIARGHGSECENAHTHTFTLAAERNEVARSAIRFGSMNLDAIGRTICLEIRVCKYVQNYAPSH
jgi:hypothetical protein